MRERGRACQLRSRDDRQNKLLRSLFNQVLLDIVAAKSLLASITNFSALLLYAKKEKHLFGDIDAFSNERSRYLSNNATNIQFYLFIYTL